jgi:hypothetical protein
MLKLLERDKSVTNSTVYKSSTKKQNKFLFLPEVEFFYCLKQYQWHPPLGGKPYNEKQPWHTEQK